MRKLIIVLSIIGGLIGLSIFALDEYIKYAEVNSFDTCCLGVFFTRLALMLVGGILIGALMGRLIFYIWKKY
jgi:H+/Cl- antiporter ClcA